MTRTAVLRPLASALVLAGVLAACSGGGGNPGIGIATGLNAIPFAPGHRNPVPSFSGTTLRGGRPISSAIFSGKVGVVNFWGSWCVECIREMPSFQTVFASLNGRVQFVGMDVLGLQGETMGAGRAFAKQAGVHYRLAFDPGGLLYAHFYATTARPIMPITVFVDSGGVVREPHFGALDATDLRKAIRANFGIT
jgi:thiol-disulfide isomerase/thioredoxin